MPPKKPNKLLNLAKTDEAQVIKAPKKTAQQLKNELLKDTKFSEHNRVLLGNEVLMPNVIPSGILRLDYEIGIGGFPRGKIVQLYGKEASWKSTICLRTGAEAQKSGGLVAWVDAEFSFDPSWARRNGINLDNLILHKPDTMEDAFIFIDKMIRGGVDVIVLDSLAALAPHKEIYANENKTERQPLDKEGMALAARLWSKWSRQGPKLLDQNDNLFMIVNQLRSSLSPYGNPVSVPGGAAVKYMNSLSLNTKRVTAKDGQIVDKQTGKVTGATYEFIIDKTKYGIIGNGGSFKTNGLTIDNMTTLRDLGIREKIIERVNSSNYLVNGEKINGQDNVTDYLREHPEIANAIEKQLREQMVKNYTENADKFHAQVSDEIDYEAMEREAEQAIEHLDITEDEEE